MNTVQPGILLDIPRVARYLTFSLKPDSPPHDTLQALAQQCDGEKTVVGVSAFLVDTLGKCIDGLRTFPGHAAQEITVPSTPGSLWVWLRGEDRGDLVHRTRRLIHTLGESFYLGQILDGFQYGPGLDLTGYEDGTENPRGDKAQETAIVTGKGPGLDGSSFVSVQQWVHDLDHFATFPESEQDRIIGRRKRDNEEMDDAPLSAHVKRTAQESFTPPVFVLRKSMPWAEGTRAGLVFVAFGRSFDAFEVLLRRMVGLEDGTTDALFRFTRPVTGSYFWCPPLKDGTLDLRAILQ